MHSIATLAVVVSTTTMKVGMTMAPATSRGLMGRWAQLLS